MTVKFLFTALNASRGPPTNQAWLVSRCARRYGATEVPILFRYARVPQSNSFVSVPPGKIDENFSHGEFRENVRRIVRPGFLGGGFISQRD